MTTRRTTSTRQLGNNEPASTWGRNIRVQRAMFDITQAQLAEAVGVSQASVSDWERGHSTPSPRLVFSIAKALHTTPEILFPWSAAA